jgi:hypothetical protein
MLQIALEEEWDRGIGCPIIPLVLTILQEGGKLKFHIWKYNEQ